MTKKQKKELSLEAIESMTFERLEIGGNNEMVKSIIHHADIEKFESHLENAGVFYYGWDRLAENRLEVYHGRI